MISRTTVLAAVLSLGILQGAAAQESPARFTGVWTGEQRRNQSNPPQGAEKAQSVTLTIAGTDGAISGQVTPFLGGSDGAILSNIHIDGKQLRADGILGEAQAAQAQGDPSPFWKNDVKIAFTFTESTAGKITGTANLTLGGVQWLKYQYTLTRDESREGPRP